MFYVHLTRYLLISSMNFSREPCTCFICVADWALGVKCINTTAFFFFSLTEAIVPWFFIVVSQSMLETVSTTGDFFEHHLLHARRKECIGAWMNMLLDVFKRRLRKKLCYVVVDTISQCLQKGFSVIKILLPHLFLSINLLPHG